MAHDGTGTQWNTAFPTNSELFPDGPKEIRDLRLALQIRLNKEHVDMAAGSVGGEHEAGSAKVYSQLLAPVQRPDATTVLDVNDKGRLWYDETSGKLKRWDGAAWVSVAVKSESYAKLSYSVVTGTNGGNIVAGTWTTRPLNTEDSDVDAIVSLPGANTFRLQTGTYRIRITASVWGCDEHCARLYNTSDAVGVIDGTRGYSPLVGGSSSISTIEGVFTIAAQKDFRVEHNCVTTQAGNGMGRGTTFVGAPNCIFMTIEIWKVTL